MGQDLQNLPGTGFNGDHRVYSNYYSDNKIVQNVAIVHPKNLLIDTLRKYFKNDNVYTYRQDQYGFPLTPDLTQKSIDDLDTTKILISDIFRYETKFYPAITIKFSGGSHEQLSINQEGTIKYRVDLEENKFKEVRKIKTPTHRVYAGIWDMNFEISIHSQSRSELEELVEIVSMILAYSSFNELRANGLLIKNVSIGSESSEQYANDYVYSCGISLNTRSEWRVEIPLENIIERIVFYFDVNRHPIPGISTQADIQQMKFDELLDITNITI